MDKPRGFGVEALPLATLDIEVPFCPHGKLLSVSVVFVILKTRLQDLPYCLRGTTPVKSRGVSLLALFTGTEKAVHSSTGLMNPFQWRKAEGIARAVVP